MPKLLAGTVDVVPSILSYVPTARSSAFSTTVPAKSESSPKSSVVKFLSASVSAELSENVPAPESAIFSFETLIVPHVELMLSAVPLFAETVAPSAIFTTENFSSPLVLPSSATVPACTSNVPVNAERSPDSVSFESTA